MAQDLNAIPAEIAAKLIFEAFKKPARSPLPAESMVVMTQAGRSELDLAGRRVALYEWGQGGRTAFCIHGWSGRASDFSAFVTPLTSAGYRVVAFDNLGHGESEGDTATLLDVREILLALQERMGPADTVFAHSIGVLYAFYALNHGVRADRLVAISGVCDFSYLISRYTSSMKLREETVELLKRHLESLFGRPTIWDEFSSHNNMSRMGAEVCLIHDANDNYVELSQSEKLKRALGDRAVLHVTRGLGHQRILAEPEVIGIALDAATVGPPQDSAS
jgi:hypothetical protein